MRRLLASLVAVSALMAAGVALAAPNQAVAMRLMRVSRVVPRGQLGVIVVHAYPGTPLCTLTVAYKGRASHSPYLKPKHPDAADGGRLAWNWRVGRRAALGTWQLRVNCGSAGSLQTPFRVVA